MSPSVERVGLRGARGNLVAIPEKRIETSTGKGKRAVTRAEN